MIANKSEQNTFGDQIIYKINPGVYWWIELQSNEIVERGSIWLWTRESEGFQIIKKKKNDQKKKSNSRVSNS